MIPAWWSLRSGARGIWAGALLGTTALWPPPATWSQTPPVRVTVQPAARAFQHKAPLAWVETDPQTGQPVAHVMNMAMSPDNSTGDWFLQPQITTTFGRRVGSTPGWSTRRPDGSPLARIQAFGGQGQPAADGTTTVDWGDGSFLRVSPTAAARYGLAPGTILYSTRLNTTNPAGYGYAYRIMVYQSPNTGGSWAVLPAPAVSGTPAARGKSPAGPSSAAPAAMVGLYSNFLFERSDGTIQIYYDNQATPWAAGHRYEQWLTMKELRAGNPLTWGPEIVVDGNQPGRGAISPAHCGMASVSERGTFPTSTLIMTHEDNAYYQRTNPVTGATERRYEVNVVVLRSTNGGQTWARVGTLQSPGGYHHLAPWHIRSKLTNLLYLTFRSDRLRQTDNPAYDPFDAAQAVVERGRPPATVQANLFVMTSADDGVTWQSFDPTPGNPYQPGGSGFGSEPGVTELSLAPTKSQLIFQWGNLNAAPSLSIQALDLDTGPDPANPAP